MFRANRFESWQADSPRYWADGYVHENVIGLILCTEKDEVVVKYSVLQADKQIFAAKYQLYLPTEQELITELEKESLILKNYIQDYSESK